jgi:hypothetical protein
MIEGLDEEVEAQVRREAGDDENVNMDNKSELSQLHSSDFEGMEF